MTKAPDRGGLIGGFLERKGLCERFVIVLFQAESVAFAQCALRVKIEKLGCGVAHLRGGFAFRLLPLPAAERVQRRLLGRGAAVTADQIEIRDRNV